MAKPFKLLKTGMKAPKPGSIIAVVIILICLPKIVSARTMVHIGIGSHSPFYHSYYRPHYGFHSRYHYRHRYRYVHGYDYWQRPWCSPGESLWRSYPIVIVERPRVIVKEKVIIKNESYPSEIQYDENTLKLFKGLRTKKSELLRKLRIADKLSRLNAIVELSSFSFDDKVRQALEEVLLSEPDSELRKEAIKAFGKVKNKKALSILEKVRVEDSDKEVRAEADHAIREINKS